MRALRRTYGPVSALLTTLLLLVSVPAQGDDDECLECHGEEGFGRDDGAPGDLYVAPKPFRASVHGEMSCVDCHEDAELEDGEHAERLDDVDCGACHEKSAAVFAESLHGKALARGDELAPRCGDCHTTHAVFPPDDPRSSTYKMNIPGTCSRCHREGTEIVNARKLGQKEVVEHYSMSIHGVGLFRRGLIVSAVCTDCHGTHAVLPHEDPASSIHRDRIPKTCMQCHAEIERVHRKVIRGALWESSPRSIPVCVDCHPPHEVRRVTYDDVFQDRDCLRCHGPSAGPQAARPGETPVQAKRIDPVELAHSAHGDLTCVKCHSGVTTFEHPPCRGTGEVDCSACHAESEAAYNAGIHGRLALRGNDRAPTCATCHGTHGALSRKRPGSPTHPTNVPALCRRCHGGSVETGTAFPGASTVDRYQMSIHGEGLASGLVVTAVCTSCHTPHTQLPQSDPRSSVHPKNLGATCGVCHAGVAEQLAASVHGRAPEPGRRAPTCEDCHTAHGIVRTDQETFRQGIQRQCGSCHPAVTESYFETYHGKVSQLGYGKTAKCSDCHGAHAVLPPSDPQSTLSRDNIVATCAKCHPGSHRRFAGYLSHATHHDPDKYPVLYYTFWAMTLLLLGTLSFFGLHTLLWLPRSIREAIRLHRRRRDAPPTQWVRRFETRHRVTHIFVIVSFFTLVITGMILKFAYTGWAQALARGLGGFESAGTLHRLAAVVTFGYFAAHLYFVWQERRRQSKTWRAFLFGPESLAPNRNDLREFAATVRWFLGRGPRPQYGRWTYWEKFDYLAVFWGVAVIGLTGLVLWFPELFTYVLPGWGVNVATIIHSDEALLAAGFIFTIHFFNTHFRPDRFPMDPVIFTGRVPLDEFEHERPREYAQLVETGTLEDHLVEPPSRAALRMAYVFGISALVLGLTLIGLIVYSMVFAYR